MTNWLSGFSHRKSHLLQATFEGSTDFPVCIKVYYGTGEDGTEKIDHLTNYSGAIDTWAGKIYCLSHCKADFSDIRFTDDGGDTKLNYWIQEKVDGNYAIFWVKVTDDVSTATTIYIYYGKASALSESDGDGVFLLFDDFDDNTLDTDKWNVGGSYTESGGLLTLESGAYIQSKLTWFQNIIIFMKAKFSISSGFIGLCKTTGGTDDAAKFIGELSTIRARNQQSTFYETTSIGNYYGNFYKFAIKWLSKYPVSHSVFNSLQYFVDSTGKAWLANSVPNETIPATETNTGVGQIIFDWIAVRKVASAGEEPVHSTWGAEETTLGLTARVESVLVKETTLKGVNSAVWDDSDPWVRIPIAAGDMLHQHLKPQLIEGTIICYDIGTIWTAFYGGSPPIIDESTGEKTKFSEDGTEFVITLKDTLGNSVVFSFYDVRITTINLTSPELEGDQIGSWTIKFSARAVMKS